MLKVPHKERERTREGLHLAVTKGVKAEVIHPDSEEVVTAEIATPVQATVATEEERQMPEQKDTDLMLAAMAYLSVLFLVPYAVRKRSTFVDFHLRQGMFLFALGVLTSFSAWVSFNAWLVASAMLVACSVACAAHAARGNAWRFPVVGRLIKRVTV